MICLTQRETKTHARILFDFFGTLALVPFAWQGGLFLVTKIKKSSELD